MSYLFQCQAGALDELAGNSSEGFQRYTRAYILLHSLSQLVHNQNDKLLLEKCELLVAVFCCPFYSASTVKPVKYGHLWDKPKVSPFQKCPYFKV
jgi:hypothetical protein